MLNNSAIEGFACLRCGNCCSVNGQVRITGDEVQSISGFLGIRADQFTERFARLSDNRSGLVLRDAEDGSCIFLGQDRLCGIEKVKPKQCLGFPVTWNYNDWEKVCSANYAASLVYNKGTM